MVETYIAINEDNKIDRILVTADGEGGARKSAPENTKLQIVPKDFDGKTGDDVSMFDKSWHLRPLAILVEEGLVEEPEGLVLNDEGSGFRPATDAELVESGRRKLEPWETLDGDNVREKNIHELYNDDLLTSEQKKEYIKRDTENRLMHVDKRSIRPLRAMLNGVDTKKDRDILKALEDEARDLRLKMKSDEA